MDAKEFELIRNYLLQFDGVEDVGFGLREVDGKNTGEVAVLVNVREKKSLSDIPPAERIPEKIGDMAIDVVSVRKIVDEPVDHLPPEPTDRYARMEPLKAGVNIRNEKKNAGIGGSLGAFVLLNGSDQLYALTNWHVVNRKVWGAKDDPVVQPYNASGAGAPIGHVRITDRKLDVAFIEVEGRHVADQNRILEVDGDLRGITAPLVGMKVFKSGARTGVTHGIITKIWSDFARVEPDKEVYGEQEVEISKGGDSGSVWMTRHPEEGLKAVLLHNLGEKDNVQNKEWASGIRMDVIQKVYGISFPG